MLTDALAQYLAVKRWRNLFLAIGPAPGDTLYAGRCGARRGNSACASCSSRPWTPASPARSAPIPAICRSPPRRRPASPRAPGLRRAGGGGRGGPLGRQPGLAPPDRGPLRGRGADADALVAIHEQWGATQLQRRFRAQAGRPMTPLDHAAWLALRAVGEARWPARPQIRPASRPLPAALKFELAGFKGARLSFRDWGGCRRCCWRRRGHCVWSHRSQASSTTFQNLTRSGTDRPGDVCRS